MNTLSALELKDRLDSSEETILVNTLSKEYFMKKHIPGSISIPTEEMEERAPHELPNNQQEIVVYCAGPTCQASPQAARILEGLGYQHVLEFSGGLEGWEEAGFPFSGSEA